VAKPDVLRCVGADQILIENAEHFAQIDLDLPDFEKEHTQRTPTQTFVHFLAY